MSTLDVRAFSMSSRRFSILRPVLRPVLTLSVILALSLVALAAHI